MRKIRPHTGLWKYLEQSGVLDSRDEEKIKATKKEYWRKYDAEYKRKKRKQKREYLISFNTTELQSVIATAKTKGLKVPEYIREATRADINQVYVVPYGFLLKEVEQTLLSYKRIIKDIGDKDKRNWLGASKNYESLEQIVTKIENYLHQLFRQGPPLTKIIEDTLRTNPQFITTLNQFVQQHHDRQKPEQKTTLI